MEGNALQVVLEDKIVAIMRRLPFDRLKGVSDALIAGGIRCIEVTFDQSGDPADTVKAIQFLKSQYGDALRVGAGTVLTTSQVEQAADAGAEYIISPNFNPAVVEATKARGALSMPGVMTPSEIMAAHESGADIVKLFPASVLGVDYIKAIRAPISHVPLMAVGGISKDNIAEYHAAGYACFGVGSHIVNAKFAAAGEYGKIEALAREFKSALAA